MLSKISPWTSSKLEFRFDTIESGRKVKVVLVRFQYVQRMQSSFQLIYLAVHSPW
jgi:hypothetical protein